jgi:hypothetical protein
MSKAAQGGPREGDARMGGIAGAQTLEELYGVLRGMQAYNSGLQDRGAYALTGSDGTRWTAEMIITEIEKAKRGEASQLTRTGGLREKAQLLLAQSRVESGASLGDKTDFYRRWSPMFETYARNGEYNSPAHVTFALEIVGRQLNYSGNPTDVMLQNALERADKAIKKARPK